MLLRRLLTGLRASGSGICAAVSLQAPLAALGASTGSAAAAAAAAASTAAPGCWTALRGLSSSCSSSTMGARWMAQLGTTPSRAALTSSSSINSSSSLAAALASSIGGAGTAWAGQQLQQVRLRTTSSHLKPKFAGGKIKSYSSYKSRFRLTGSGKVLYARPGHVHKRFSKSKRQLFDLSHYQSLTPRYAKTVKKIGFKMRKF